MRPEWGVTLATLSLPRPALSCILEAAVDICSHTCAHAPPGADLNLPTAREMLALAQPQACWLQQSEWDLRTEACLSLACFQVQVQVAQMVRCKTSPSSLSPFT